MTFKVDLEEIGRLRERDDAIAAYLDKSFPGFEFRTYGKHRCGFYGAKQFGRRKWAIEVWQEGANDELTWKAGLYIENHVQRHNYFWELAGGSTPEQAAEWLKLRVDALKKELSQIAGEIND